MTGGRAVLFKGLFSKKSGKSPPARIWEVLTGPHASILEFRQRRRAHLISSLLISELLLSVLIVLSLPLVNQTPEFENVRFDFYWITSTGTFFLLFAYVLSRTRYYLLAAWISIVTTQLVVFTMSAISPDSTILPYFLILGVFLSSLLLPLRATILVLALTLSGIALFPAVIPGTSEGYIFNVFRFVLLVGGLALVAARVTEEDLEKIEQQSQELSKSGERFRATQRQVEKALNESRERYLSLFEDSPVSLWEEDFSVVKTRLDRLRASGVKDFRKYFEEHPEEVVAFSEQVRILDVNKVTLKLYKAESKAALLSSLRQIFNDESFEHFRIELVYIAEGLTHFAWEGINRTLDGDNLFVSLRWSVMPGYEDTLAKVIVSITDITERKQAEEKLFYASTHDALTGLYNRAYFNQELAKLESSRRFPVSIVIVDVDDLKTINDNYGHAAGDHQLQQTAKVLSKVFRAEDTIARIGGDEFAVLLPDTKALTAYQILERVRRMVEYLNNHNGKYPLNLSSGAATARQSGSLDQALKEADDRMYSEKQAKIRGRI